MTLDAILAKYRPLASCKHQELSSALNLHGLQRAVLKHEAEPWSFDCVGILFGWESGSGPQGISGCQLAQ